MYNYMCNFPFYLGFLKVLSFKLSIYKRIKVIYIFDSIFLIDVVKIYANDSSSKRFWYNGIANAMSGEYTGWSIVFRSFDVLGSWINVCSWIKHMPMTPWDSLWHPIKESLLYILIWMLTSLSVSGIRTVRTDKKKFLFRKSLF